MRIVDHTRKNIRANILTAKIHRKVQEIIKLHQSLDYNHSRKLYANTFPYFMKFCQMDSYNAMLQIPVKQLESKIRDYLVYLREDKKVAVATISLYLAVITHFYEMNDVRLNWKRLNKFKGRLRNAIEDVPYTRDQIKTLIDRASLRDRSMILLMASAGLRRAALTILRLADLKFIDKFSLYKIAVFKHLFLVQNHT